MPFISSRPNFHVASSKPSLQLRPSPLPPSQSSSSQRRLRARAARGESEGASSGGKPSRGFRNGIAGEGGGGRLLGLRWGGAWELLISGECGGSDVARVWAAESHVSWGSRGGGTEMFLVSMRKSFKDSIKVLEADIQHANTLASEFPRDYDGACLQMRMSYSPAAHLFLFLVQWTDCHLAGALGLLRILIYKVYVDGTTTMSVHERKASIREFYAVIFPSLLQLQRGITDMEDKKQKTICMERYRRRDDEERRQVPEIDAEREEECGICMEMNSKIVLPNCSHAMCMKCYREWHSRSQSCPFCRDCLKRVNSGDLWMYMDSRDVVDMATVSRENVRRLFMYIDKLPLVIPGSVFDAYDSHVK